LEKREKPKKCFYGRVINLQTTFCVTMDKSVNNFEDVDDTMSSVYNAWRKKLKLESRESSVAIKIYTFILHLSFSLSPSRLLILFMSVLFRGFYTQTQFFGTYLILITLNNENFLLLDSFGEKTKNHKKLKNIRSKIILSPLNLTTQFPNQNIF
jgi:hypothetical protein